MSRPILSVTCKARQLPAQLERSIKLLEVHYQLEAHLPSSNEPVRIELTEKAIRELEARRG